jgi:hypothetical protein
MYVFQDTPLCSTEGIPDITKKIQFSFLAEIWKRKHFCFPFFRLLSESMYEYTVYVHGLYSAPAMAMIVFLVCIIGFSVCLLLTPHQAS